MSGPGGAENRPELPISSPYRSTPDAPVTDEERASIGERLNEAYATGTLDELDYRSRLDNLYAARRLGELVPVVSGLPPLPTYPTPEIVAQLGRPGELASTDRRGSRVAAYAVGTVAVALLVVIVLVLLVVL
ncbi:DUF1707 SHOCT-like domain-containing protein [Microlunatus sp. Y2014]|uniref:DUF1707 SHOCT-like domain-containing protein n=1 Tax=Microlunatus sp. Y2014 TaxID=3418488 RepID=UPI003DA7492B